MATAYKPKQTAQQALIDELRYHLFEIGIALTPQFIDQHLLLAERNCLKRLRFAAEQEQLPTVTGQADGLMTYLNQLQKACRLEKKDSSFWAWDRFKQELKESYANEAMASVYRTLWDKALRHQAHAFDSLWQWLLVTLPQHQQLSFLEQWGSHQGHPYHPNTKAKMGLSRREVLKYSPEYQAQIDIYWLALAKNHAKTPSGHEAYWQQLTHTFPKLILTWRRQLEERCLSIDDYQPIPVHPWQWHNSITKNFSHYIDQGVIIGPLVKQNVSPSMAFRTMIPDESLGFHIKLATAIHTTSAMRTVSPASVNNGPRVSKLLRDILRRENYFGQTIDVLSDATGLHFDSGIEEQADLRKHLSCLFRENPNDKLLPQEIAVPLACLFTTTPISQQPLLIEIIEHSQLGPLTYFEHYCQILLRSQLTLCYKYGIGLEAHQQNTLIVFDNHRAVKHFNRDLGGIRIDREHLSQQGFEVSLEPGSLIESHGFEEVRHKFIHANLQSNLAYWVNTLAQHYSLDKSQMWAIVKSTIDAVFATLAIELPEQFLSREKQYLYHSPWLRKSLLRMRLEHCQGEYLYRHIDNPLSACDDEK